MHRVLVLTLHFAISVDFDLDDGPMITGVYPPIDLLSSEEENM